MAKTKKNRRRSKHHICFQKSSTATFFPDDPSYKPLLQHTGQKQKKMSQNFRQKS